MVLKLLEAGSGNISLGGENLSVYDKRKKEFRRMVQPIFQNPFTAFSARRTVDSYLYETACNLGGIRSKEEAAKKIRARFQAPLLFLTAYSGEADKVNGFLIGADDYIVKPFSNMEMIMRIRAVFRRAEQGTPPAAAREETAEKKGMIPIGDLLLDTESQSLIKDQAVISLTYTEYRILELMAKHRKKIYSLDNIYQSVWGEDAVGDGAIMVHIKNIRKKMGDNSRNPKYIKTAWGRGYYID